MSTATSSLTPVRAIRLKCLDCSGGSASEVRDCTLATCALHKFRLGKNPNYKPKTPKAE